ncbi:hypothetical protein [Tsukamurella strandjordii]|uniref:Uncharacterized protein n=1 Tax=Tsukamurella strandjordii TaxID=147577 RepID=A0AA90NGW3_9ACTN|nr:hypothetical protein [Tsukamurella strandjordii]MDP0398096.1 hypothetical protein [Tsukamurella strandjordii]
MKRHRYVPLTLVVLASLLVGLTAGCSTIDEPAPAPPPARSDTVVQPRAFDSKVWQSLPETDRQLFTQLAFITRTFTERAGEIWAPAFRPDRQPRVLGALPAGAKKPTYAYAIGHPNPTALGKATPVDLPKELGLQPVYRIDSGPGIDALAEVPFFAVDNGVISYNYGPGARDTWDPTKWLLSRVDVHEAFHTYQGTFGLAPGQEDPMTYPRDPASVHALALVEDRVLAQPATTADDARATLRSFLALRATRYQQQPGVRAVEREQESYEGTARFAEDAFVTEGGQDDDHPNRVPDDSRDLFNYLTGNRSYQVGAVLGRLLERTNGTAWRDRIVAGASPYEAVQQFIGDPAPEERDRLVAAAKQQYGYDQLLDKVIRADLPSVR